MITCMAKKCAIWPITENYFVVRKIRFFLGFMIKKNSQKFVHLTT